MATIAAIAAIIASIRALRFRGNAQSADGTDLSPISGVVIVAQAKGMFKNHGLDITVSSFTSGKQCLNTVIGGGANIATTAEIADNGRRDGQAVDRLFGPHGILGS